MQTALDLSAVDEAVNVAGIHSLPVFCTGAFAHFRTESVAELTLPLASSLHLHLVRRTDADTGTAVHHEMSGALRDTDGAILIFCIWVGFHLKHLLVID